LERERSAMVYAGRGSSIYLQGLHRYRREGRGVLFRKKFAASARIKKKREKPTTTGGGKKKNCPLLFYLRNRNRL